MVMTSSFASDYDKESLNGDLVVKDQIKKTTNYEAGVREKSDDSNSRDYCTIEEMDGLIPVTVSDVHRVSRKAEESAIRRFQAASWLQKVVGNLGISDEPSEEELRFYLRNGLVLCNLMNKIHPGAVPKIVDNPALMSPRAHFVYQYFENVRNFLVAVEELKLPSFEASDLEQGTLVAGSMTKVVECILALKSYCEWRDNGGMGLWKFRNTSKSGIKPSPQGPLGFSSSIKHRLEKPSTIADPYSSANLESSESDFKLEGKEVNSTDVIRTQTKNTSQISIHSENYSPCLSDLNATWILQIGSKILEALQKSDSRSLSNLVRTVLGGKKLEEVPMLVEFVLKKVTYEFEQRLAVQGEQLKELRISSKELLKREDRLVSRLKSLEALAAGSGEEVKLIMNHLQLIKNEKREIEKEKKMHEEGVQKLLNDREEQQIKVKELKNEVEYSTRESKEKKLELDFHTKLEWESKIRIKELMLVLEGSVKKGQEIQAAMGSELRNLKNDRIKFQDRISLQIPAFKNIRSILDVTRQDVLNMKLGWQEEMDALEFKLEGITGAATRYYKVQAENRKLYNTIEELKGKIRVYCRVRPIRSETKGIVDFIGENGDILINNPNKQGREGSKLFNFNKVYRASASQGEVFFDSQQLIRSTLDGFNVCIFAYGQTGSGKTYTMTGPSTGLEEDWGINYRSLNDLFQTSYSRKDAFTYEVGVQMMEIYNEHVRDLLVTDGNKKNLEIRNNSQQNGLHVPDANFVPVKSTEDVLELMKIGQKNRTVGATALNEHSSRSHSVLIVHVQGTDLASQSILRGRLHLVDLAGSERVDKSEVTGERLKEAQHINKSLSALGDVIAALAQKSVHVPYRNSKLTQLLQDSLGGQAKAVMFVHISQDSESYGETVSTLKFGERVASVELGAARSNRESWEIRELREQIASLQEALLRKDVEISKRDAEIERLQTLKAVRTSGTSHSLTSGKQRLKDFKLLTVERMSNSEADTQSVTKSLLEVMAYDEEAVSISTRQTHKGSLLLGPTCHKASEDDFEGRTKNEDKLGLRRVMHKRSVSIDSQGSIASTISNKCTKNYTQRKVHRKLMLDREPSLKYWKDRPYMSSNILLASVNGKDQFHNRDHNDSPKVEIQYHGSNVVNSLPAQATPIISKSPSATWYSSRNMKPSPQKLSKLQLPEYPQGKHSATHESHETVRVHENSAPNGSIAALQCSSQTSDVQEDFEDKSTELSGLSHESDTDDSAVTSCEQLAPLVSDIHRTSQGAEKRTSRHRPIPRPPFRHIRKLANDEQPPASRWRRPSVMASGLSGARGVKASSSVGSRNPLKVTSKS